MSVIRGEPQLAGFLSLIGHAHFVPPEMSWSTCTGQMLLTKHFCFFCLTHCTWSWVNPFINGNWLLPSICMLQFHLKYVVNDSAKYMDLPYEVNVMITITVLVQIIIIYNNRPTILQ